MKLTPNNNGWFRTASNYGPPSSDVDGEHFSADRQCRRSVTFTVTEIEDAIREHGTRDFHRSSDRFTASLINHQLLKNGAGPDPTIAGMAAGSGQSEDLVGSGVTFTRNPTPNPIEAPFHDIGIKSVFHLSAAIKQAGTIILNGPAGVFENNDFALGTIEMLNACAESDGFAVMGGGHTATLVVKRGLTAKMGHVSTGGGACLDYIAGRPLPGVVSLEQSAVAFGIDIKANPNNA